MKARRERFVGDDPAASLWLSIALEGNKVESPDERARGAGAPRGVTHNWRIHLRGQKLFYRITIEDTLTDGLLPRSWEEDGVGTFRIANGVLTVELRRELPDEATARRHVRRVLRSFEIDHHLKHGYRISFNLESAVSTEDDHVNLMAISEIRASLVSPLVRHPKGVPYPKPDPGFATNKDVERAYRRWDNYQRGKEPLPTVAYYILTLLEQLAGSRSDACTRFGISRNVLDEVGRISSTRGTNETARKADHDAMAPGEAAWLVDILSRIVRRLGEQKPRSKITMATRPKGF